MRNSTSAVLIEPTLQGLPDSCQNDESTYKQLPVFFYQVTENEKKIQEQDYDDFFTPQNNKSFLLQYEHGKSPKLSIYSTK